MSGSNSTSTSTSLSGVKSSRSTEPKKDSRRMWWRRQKSAILAVGASIAKRCGMSRLRLDETAYTSLGGNSNRTWAQRAQSDWARHRRFAGWPQGPVSYIAIRRALQPVEPAAVVGEDLALLG